MNRRQFILASAAVALGASCNASCDASEVPATPLKRGKVNKAAVLWYSQTGNTRRIGRVIAKALERRGVTVTASEMRDVEPSALASVDLIVVGSPVFYMMVPVNVIDILSHAPSLAGIAAASFVTFGGPGDNQHNTAVRLLAAATAKGAAPVGMDTFGAISTFAPTWSMGNAQRTLAYRDQPNETTYARAIRFADTLVENVAAGQTIRPETEFEAVELMLPLNMAWWTKLLIGRHVHDPQKCVRCGACVTACPVDAVSIQPYRIDTDACIACFGCVNNCPADAIDMRFMREKVVGYLTFAKQESIQIPQPAILTQ